jgi:hypothetical protein
MAMSYLQVLQTSPIEKKALLFALEVIDPLDDRMITFDIDKVEPCLSPSITYKLSIIIKNIMIHPCITNEHVSMCIMISSI